MALSIVPKNTKYDGYKKIGLIREKPNCPSNPVTISVCFSV
jgi:hypothetical protein